MRIRDDDRWVEGKIVEWFSIFQKIWSDPLVMMFVLVILFDNFWNSCVAG